jgi:hypothetical protein
MGLLMYETHKAKEDGRLDQLPTQPGELTEEEVMRLAILMSQPPDKPHPLLWYTTAHMPPGLS